MKILSPFRTSLLADRFIIEPSLIFSPRCKPKILIVTDGQLSFTTGGGGLTRFIEAITSHASVSLKPTLTLAFRGSHAASVSIGGTTYAVQQNFNFATTTPALTLAHYDQVWMFGFSSGGSLENKEIQAIANFMNAGGGVFSTGDHQTLGATMGSRLPRIRRMREWSNVPGGSGPLPAALRRIDTVVNPGTNNLYEFADQGDAIPQRIYPNYAVTGPGNGSWTATVHRVLLLSGATASRTSGQDAQFSNDMDVLPDHPHESECYAVTAASILDDSSTDAGMNFAEWPAAASGGARFGSEIVAFGISGGRSVDSKPPVTPRMFGVIAAYDGHRANPLAGSAARPGRIVCDSTWHHFVNVNLNGMGKTEAGVFEPDENLKKIYRYYQNMVDWLQPSNRRVCSIFSTLTLARFHPDLLEDLEVMGDLSKQEHAEVIGQGLAALIDKEMGEGSADLMVIELLRANAESADLGDKLASQDGLLNAGDRRSVVAMTLGRGMAEVAAALPSLNDPELLKLLASDKHEKAEASMRKAMTASVSEGIKLKSDRLSERIKRLNAVGKSAALVKPRD
jgi:hypothetical protein